MKKYQANNSTSKIASPMARINKDRIMMAFKLMGYAEDFQNVSVTVLRQTHFPFRRITIPHNHNISVELLKLYLNDAQIDYNTFNDALISLSR